MDASSYLFCGYRGNSGRIRTDSYGLFHGAELYRFVRFGALHHARPDTTYVYAFVLGLIADLLTHTPVGLTPLLLLVAVFCLSRVFEVLDDTSLAMPLIALAATLLVFELLFAIALLIFGYQGSFFEIFAQRVIPAAILNSLIAALLFVVMRRLPFAQASNEAWQVPTSGRFR